MQNSLLRLGIAVVLAVLAGVGNYYWMTLRSKPLEYVRFKETVERDKPVGENSLEAFPISGNAEQLKKTFVPWDEKDNLVGRIAIATFEKNSLALAQHFVGRGPQWQVLGPFRLISVGERVRNSGRGGFSEGTSGQGITIAYKLDKDAKGDYVNNEKAQQLLDILYLPADSNSSIGKIVAIQLYPADESSSNSTSFAESKSTEEGAESLLPLAQNERALMVPLKDVESIPEVMVRGSEIGFVVKL